MPRTIVVPLLAFRFLLSKSADGFLSFISWVSVVGIALGVMALTVVTSVINGFEGELARVITGMNGEVVFYSRGEPVSDANRIEAQLRKVLPEAKAVTASFVAELMAAGPHAVSGAILEGIDAQTIGTVTAVPERVVSGRLPQGEGEVTVAAALAAKLGVKEGDTLRLIAPFVGDESGQGEGAPRAIDAKVVGIVKMGLYEYDSKFVFATLGFVQRFLDQPGRVTSFKVRLAGGTDPRAAADRLSANFGYPFRAKDWGQLNKNLFYAIKLEKAVISIILTVIVLVAAFNVVSTLMMMIHDKTKEISILKAMGMRPGQAFQLFCLVGMGIGVVGVIVGVSVGALLNWILAKTHWIDLPADIYYIGFLPVVTQWPEVAMIAGVALVITFAATLYPAIRVSIRPPLEGLRYE